MPRYVQRQFGWLELIVVALAVLGCFVIGVPVVMHYVERGRNTAVATCLNNQRQLAVGLLAYAQDAQETLPLPDAWIHCTGLRHDAKLFSCPLGPSSGTPQAPHYGMNASLFTRDPRTGQPRGVTLGQIDQPAVIELTGDITGPTPSASTLGKEPNPFPGSFTLTALHGHRANAAFRHENGTNCCSYVDGHTACLRKSDLVYQPTAKFNLPR